MNKSDMDMRESDYVYIEEDYDFIDRKAATAAAIVASNTSVDMEKAMNSIPHNENVVEVVRCKDCKYFEYDHVSDWNGIPVILAHECCLRWGDGCKTWENGYCFLGEAK